jgi:hypothetical protein
MWFATCGKRSPTSPLTGLPLASIRLTRNTRLAAAIAAWRASLPRAALAALDGEPEEEGLFPRPLLLRRGAPAPPEGQPPSRRARTGEEATAGGRFFAARGLGGTLEALHAALHGRDAVSLVAVMSASRAVGAAQRAGCAALHALLADAPVPSRRASVTAAGGAEALVAALRAHPGDADVAEAACGALRLLTGASGGEPQLRAAAAGAPEALADALARWPDNVGIAESATAALANLSVSAWWSGTPPLLRATLLRFPHNQHIQLAAVAGLRNMDRSRKAEARFACGWLRRMLFGAVSTAGGEATALQPQLMMQHVPPPLLPLSAPPPAA